MRADAAAARGGDADLAAIAARLDAAAGAYEQVVDYVLAGYKSDVRSVFAGSVPYLKLAGIAHGGWQMLRAAVAARQLLERGGDIDPVFLRNKIATARFFANHFLVLAPALRETVVEGAAPTLALAIEDF
jgi:3-(methylthio)propanoyl-CoA dehydrogenase